MRAVAEFIVAPDAELVVLNELNAELPALFGAPVSVSTSLPSDRPAAFVRVLVVGGSESSMVVDNPTIAVECWATREGDAARLAATASAVLSAAGRAGVMGGVTCYNVATLARPQNLPHPDITDRKRFSFTVSADLRMASI